METEKNETEQVYEELTTDNEETADEQPEEVDEETVEEGKAGEDEILSEEDLEIEREIESYSKKSEELDAILSDYKAKKVDEVKRNTMLDFNYTEAQIERYSRYIDGETADEIKQSVFKLMSEIPPKDNYIDPTLMNGAKQKPVADTQSKLEEMGKAAFERVKHKVFPFFGRR